MNEPNIKPGQEYCETHDSCYYPVDPGKGTHVWNGKQIVPKNHGVKLVLEGLALPAIIIAAAGLAELFCTLMGAGL